MKTTVEVRDHVPLCLTKLNSCANDPGLLAIINECDSDPFTLYYVTFMSQMVLCFVLFTGVIVLKW